MTLARSYCLPEATASTVATHAPSHAASRAASCERCKSREQHGATPSVLHLTTAARSSSHAQSHLRGPHDEEEGVDEHGNLVGLTEHDSKDDADESFDGSESNVEEIVGERSQEEQDAALVETVVDLKV